MKNVVILGGGPIGRACYALLHGHPGLPKKFSPWISDPYQALPAGYQVIPVEQCEDAFLNPKGALEGAHYCVNLVPCYDQDKISRLLQTCHELGVHYLDCTEDVETGQTIRMLMETQEDILVAPHCGLAPGIINMIGHSLITSIAEPERMTLRVGALPRGVSNDMRYLCGWSVRGLVNEYLKPVHIILGGEEIITSPLDSIVALERCFIDGVEYEAFPTSGGCSTLMGSSLSLNLVDFSYRSLRPPGHLQTLFDAFGPNPDVEACVAHMERYRMSDDSDDVVIVFADVTGKDYVGKPITTTFVQKSHAGWFESVAGVFRLSAIQRTTAGGLVSILWAHDHGVIPNGYFTQETLSWNDLRALPTFSYLGFS